MRRCVVVGHRHALPRDSQQATESQECPLVLQSRVLLRLYEHGHDKEMSVTANVLG